MRQGTNKNKSKKVIYFNYLANDIGYVKNYDIDVKLDRFQVIFGIINHIFRNRVRQEKIKILQSYSGPCTVLWKRIVDDDEGTRK